MINSKTKLAIELSKLEGFVKPKLKLRQYLTPPSIASDLLWSAYMNGDLINKDVVDLGCGTGVLMIGAALLGARVTGYEVDADAIKVAISNAQKMKVKIIIFEQDIESVKDPCETVIMNPPFMVKGGKNDKVFLSKAFELSSTVYSIHTSQTREWVKGYAASNGFNASLLNTHEFALPRTYAHHLKDKSNQRVDLWKFFR